MTAQKIKPYVENIARKPEMLANSGHAVIIRPIEAANKLSQISNTFQPGWLKFGLGNYSRTEWAR